MPRIEEPPERRAAGTVAILFAEVDAHLAEGVHLHCCSDVDFLGAQQWDTVEADAAMVETQTGVRGTWRRTPAEPGRVLAWELAR